MSLGKVQVNNLNQGQGDIQAIERHFLYIGRAGAVGEESQLFSLGAQTDLEKTFADSENSWTVNMKDIDQSTFDLSVKNPNKKEEAALRSPKEILEEIKALDEESAEILNSILELI